MARGEKEGIHKLILSALLMALGLVLPFFTGQIPQVGNMLLPMHLPVLVCGLICGWKYGLAVGWILPLLRSVLFGMPVLFPRALAMAFELAAYGGLAGLFYERSRWKCIVALYRALIAAMIGGRMVWGGVMVVLMGMKNSPFTWKLFLLEAFFNAIPGILLQLLFIPGLMLALGRTGMVPMHGHRTPAEASE
jgi:thiamine transporter ThiT